MRRLLALLGVLVLAIAATACGDDDTEIGAGDDTTTTSAPATIDDDTTTTTEPDDGDDTTTTTEPDDGGDRPEFTGSFEVDPETGQVDASEYAAFVDQYGAPAGGAEDAALEMLESRYGGDVEPMPEPDVASEIADGGRTVVTVVYDGLPDDSVAAERYEFVFMGEGDELMLEAVTWSSRCQPGRGHQQFDVGLCL